MQQTCECAFRNLYADMYSKYFEVQQLSNTKSSTVTAKPESIFGHWDSQDGFISQCDIPYVCQIQIVFEELVSPKYSHCRIFFKAKAEWHDPYLTM